MKLEFEVELADSPGQLSELLQLVAQHGGNVVSVLHRHEKAVGGRVPVAVSADVPEPAAIKFLDALARRYRILRVDREGGPAQASLLLVGHVFEADLRKIFEALYSAGADVGEVDARLAGRAHPSAVLARASADDGPTLRRAVEQLRALAEPLGLTVIEQLEADSVE